MSQVYSHEGQLHMVDRLPVAETCFTVEAYKQLVIASCNEQSEENSFLSDTPRKGMKANPRPSLCL